MEKDLETSWSDSVIQRFSPLTKNIEADVVIIGGGLTGILTAYLLRQSGERVVVLEANRLGQGVTNYTTAFLTQVIDTQVTDLVQGFGEERARLVWQSGQLAIDTYDKIIAEEKIECEFERVSGFIYARTEKEWNRLVREYERAQRLHLRTNIRETNNFNFPNAGVWEIPLQAKIHPLTFLSGLVDRAADQGVQFFEATKAVEIKESVGQVVVFTDNQVVTAKQVVIATHRPLNNPWPVFLKKGLYKTYVLELELKPDVLKPGIYWDMERPYHYFRVDRKGSHDRIILGGEDHRRDIPITEDKNFRALEVYAKQIFHDHSYSITRRWTGPILESIDGLPLIGSISPRQFVATAFSGNGMTYAMIAGLMAHDWIAGRDNPWTALYNPRRVPTLRQLWNKGRDYTLELWGGAVRNFIQY